MIALGRKEFAHGLHMMDLIFTNDEVDALFSALTASDKENASYGFTQLRIENLIREEDDLDVAVQKWVARDDELSRQVSDTLEEFRKFDISNDKCITRTQFRQTVRDLGMPLSERELYLISSRFKTVEREQGTGAIKIDYRAFFLFVSSRKRASELREAFGNRKRDDRMASAQLVAPNRRMDEWFENVATDRQLRDYTSLSQSIARFNMR